MGHHDYPGCSEVIFELFKEEGRTKLKLTQTDLASFPDDPHFVRRHFEDGWNLILANKLKHYLESGKD